MLASQLALLVAAIYRAKVITNAIRDREGGTLKQYAAKSVDELNQLIMSFGEDVLFRGQTSHYGEVGAPSIGSSFDRKGCIPSEMLKWCRYSQSVLDAYIAKHRADLAVSRPSFNTTGGVRFTWIAPPAQQ